MSDDTERTVAVEMPPEQWDVVIHALEEEMAQLEPKGEWIGTYPGEDSAVAIGDVYEEIFGTLNEETDNDD